MSQCPLIFIPLKTTEEVDWVGPLKKYIETTYMDDSEKYAEELHIFSRVRQDMRGAGLDNTGRDLLYRYFGQLDLLELRFQVDENHVKISFPWYDAFTQKKISQHSLAYEKACVIFNIAAVVSNIASNQNRSEAQGLKLAYHNYQLAAGIFTYINENFLHAPSSDLNREILKVLIQFMLAQAQECFLEKCINEKKKNTLIAKLASQLNYLYTNILDALSEALCKKLFPQSLTLLAKLKIKLYSSIAQFNKAKSLEEEDEYGEAVSRFTLAEQLSKEAISCAYNLNRTVGVAQNNLFPLDAGSALNEICKRNHDEYLLKMESAVKENDMIYHHPVIKHDVLVPIDKLPASKIIPFSQLYNPSELPKIIGIDIFSKLIPLSVHESASLYSEEMAKMVRSETERVDVADSELDASLLYMNLPECLSKFQKEDNNLIQTLIIPPEEIIQQNKEIYSKQQNEKSLESLLSSLPKTNKELRATLEECTSILDVELRDSESLRAKFQDLWTQTPSSSVASGFRQEVKLNKELLEKAVESDNMMFSKFNSNRNEINIMRSDPEQDKLGQLYAEIITTASSKSSLSNLNESLVDLDKEDLLSNSVKVIEESIDKLKALKREREDVLKDLKEQVKNDDISSLLILNKKSISVEPQLFANELEKYRSHQDRITTTIHHQQATLQEITNHLKKLMENEQSKNINKGWSLIDNTRNGLNNKLKKAVDVFYEIYSGSNDGIAFYNDIKPVIQNLISRIRKYSDDRKLEREHLQQSIEKNKQDSNYNLLQSHLQKYETSNNNQSEHNITNMFNDMRLNDSTPPQINNYQNNINPYSNPSYNAQSQVQAPPNPNYYSQPNTRNVLPSSIQHTKPQEFNYSQNVAQSAIHQPYLDNTPNQQLHQVYPQNHPYQAPPPAHLQQYGNQSQSPYQQFSNQVQPQTSNYTQMAPSQYQYQHQQINHNNNVSPLNQTLYNPTVNHLPPNQTPQYNAIPHQQSNTNYQNNSLDLLSGEAPYRPNYNTTNVHQQAQPNINYGNNNNAPPIPPNPYSRMN